MSTIQGYSKRIVHSDGQPVECGNGRLLIGHMRAKVGNEMREDDLYFVTPRNGGNMIAWGAAKKACELAQCLDQEDTIITLRFPALSLGAKLHEAIAQTAEGYLSQKADPEAQRGPKRVKHEHLDEVLNPAFAGDGLYKHGPANDDSNFNRNPVNDQVPDGDVAPEATKEPDDQQSAQEQASRSDEERRWEESIDECVRSSQEDLRRIPFQLELKDWSSVRAIANRITQDMREGRDDWKRHLPDDWKG